ncbi:MAG: VOC family protein, partial [Nitrospiraceae bacterium]
MTEEQQDTITVTIVPVKDMDRAVRFYQDVLGYPLKFKSPEWSEFNTQRVILALQKARGDFRAQQGDEARFTIDVQGIDAEVARLGGKDVRFAVELHEEAYGKMAIFHDSEGNGVELV